MKLIYLLIFVLLTSCKLEYQPFTETISNVKIELKESDEVSFIIKKILNFKFNKNNTANYKYKLIITNKVNLEGFNLGSDQFSNSFKTTIVADVNLIEIETNTSIFKKTFNVSENYVVSKNSIVADYKARQYVVQNLGDRVANLIYNDIQEYVIFFLDGARQDS
jgi:hypothetical protein